MADCQRPQEDKELMMMKRGEYSLEEFLKCYKIRIPVIQRDYAQGRREKKVTAIRESFLRDIVDCLCGEKKDLNLDFVFGEYDDDKQVVLPIDGQQRLTTLFLAYWYFGRLPQGDKTYENWALLSYETRRMASRFVEGLLNSMPTYEWGKGQSPEKWIARQPWFRPIWKRDATVSGMLTTLRTLHAVVTGCGLKDQELRERIDPLRLNLIKFYFDPLENVNADEGYRKMNARGRALSDWENIRSVVEDGVYKEGFPTPLRDLWIKSLSGAWLSAMESYSSTDGMLEECENVDVYIDQCADKTNEGFRNLLDLAIYLYAVRNIDDEKERYFEVAKKINQEGGLEGSFDYMALELMFGERAVDWRLVDAQGEERLMSVIICGRVVEKKDWGKCRINLNENNISEWQDAVWQKIRPLALAYYETLFRRHQASPVDYFDWIVPDVIECAAEFYDSLLNTGENKIRDWKPIDRAQCLATGWKSDGVRETNWFWSKPTDPKAACKVDFTELCKDVLFVRNSSQKQTYDNVTAVRFYIIAKALSQKLTLDRRFAVRHLYNLLDNTGTILVTALGKTLEFVDKLFDSQIDNVEGDVNAQERCLCEFRNNVFGGCEFQMDEEIVKSRCNRRADYEYLEYEKVYSKLNGTVGFLINADCTAFDKMLHDKFDAVVWKGGTLPRRAFFEVVKSSTNINFPPSNDYKLRIPSEDGNVAQWKYNFIKPLWRKIFVDYTRGTMSNLLPEIAFMLEAGEIVFNNMSYLWRHGSDGRFYLNKTDKKLCTYVWLSYTERARAILDALSISFVTSWNATCLPLENVGCSGYFIDISPALNNSASCDIRLYKRGDKNWGKTLKILGG